ncbi:Pyruvate carboxyltransferase [Senna tora]|uniref:Pyruvate carboxyltransferase n=1 Tax=Senna tora TaxID=362788 RepID=A0A834SG15_9FABA|nr:Pyruvate carboxyltransferase [Senna tora]
MGRLGFPNTSVPLYNGRNSKKRPHTTAALEIPPEIPHKQRKLSIMAENPREIGWLGSSDSDDGEDVEEMQENLTLQDTPTLDPRLAHAPVVSLEPEFVQANRAFWEKCLVGLLIDSRKFKVSRMQSIIDHYWYLRGSARVVGRVRRYYVIHFDVEEDHQQILKEGPWAMQGRLLTMFPWEPNLVLSNLLVTEVTVWVQLWNIPLEYQTPLMAEKIGSLLGEVREIDWAPTIPRNIWIFRICKGCGRIGHLPHDCDRSREQVDATLDAQRQWIQDQFGNAYGTMVDQAYFVPEARRFEFQPSRRTTYIRALYNRNGFHYRPRCADSVDFYFDPWVLMDAHGNMDPPTQMEVEQEDSQDPEESIPEQAMETQPDFAYHQHEQADIPTIQEMLNPEDPNSLDPEWQRLVEHFCPSENPMQLTLPGIRLNEAREL